MKKYLLVALWPCLLVACTGIEDTSPSIRLAVLTDGGKTLGYVTSSETAAGTYNPGTPSVPTSLTNPISVTDGVDLQTLNNGRSVALTRRQVIETRDAALANPQPFKPLPTGVTPCFNQTVMSAQHDRLLSLSACDNGIQTLALYRTDGFLIWTAPLPLFTPPVRTDGTPPIRLAVQGDIGIVARPALSGGSEVIRAGPRNSGDPVQDLTAVVSDPQPTASIRDLAPFGSSIYAATDTGVHPLLPSGLPDSTNTLAAFGPIRLDRLWSGSTGTRNLLAAWRDNRLNNTGGEYVRLWDGARSTAANVDWLSEVRDATFASDGNLYVLTSSRILRYDTVYGLAQGNWQAATIVTSLSNPVSLTWLVPPTNP